MTFSSIGDLLVEPFLPTEKFQLNDANVASSDSPVLKVSAQNEINARFYSHCIKICN